MPGLSEKQIIVAAHHWRKGWDTHWIAADLKVLEEDVYNRIEIIRRKARELAENHRKKVLDTP